MTALLVAFRRLSAMAALAFSLALPVAAQEFWPPMQHKPAWKAAVDKARADYCKARLQHRPRIADHQKYDPFGEYMSYARFYKWRTGPKLELDRQGVPQLLLDGKFDYNPLTVMQFILTRYSQMVAAGSKTPPPDLEAAVDRLLRMQNRKSGAFEYGYPKVYYVTGEAMPAGWVSGMTQGVSLSVFARLYRLTGDRRYLEAGNRALDFMILPTTEGGTRSSLAYLHPSLSSYVTFEEYIAHPSTYTLNGFIYAAVGLYDWSKVTEAGQHSATAAKYYDESIRTIEQILPYYDVGGFSAYDLAHLTHGRMPHFGITYHRNHIELLTLLHTMTGNRWFLHFAGSWAQYADMACFHPAGTTPAAVKKPGPVKPAAVPAAKPPVPKAARPPAPKRAEPKGPPEPELKRADPKGPPS